MTRSLLAALTLALTACGGGGGGSPTAPPAPPTTVTVDFTGNTRASSPTSCGGDRHSFDAAQGPISVTLMSTTGNVGLSAQLCAGDVAGPDCTIPRRPIALGQMLTAERRGVSSQTLSLLTANCGGGGPAPVGEVTYAVRVSYLR